MRSLLIGSVMQRWLKLTLRQQPCAAVVHGDSLTHSSSIPQSVIDSPILSYTSTLLIIICAIWCTRDWF